MLFDRIALRTITWRAILLASFFAVALPASAGAQHDAGILHILPIYVDFFPVSDEEFAQQVQLLRSRFSEGGPVRIGFSVYIDVTMDQWNVTTEAEAAANLASTVARLDTAIARARAYNLPIALQLITPIRSATDASQAQSQREDRRVMQWYSDNSLADGWWTLSRYARRQYRVKELYLTALARVVANRIARYPTTVVSVAGDGEVELAFKNTGPPYADYSPFAIAEFRDWIRGEGLYAPGQPYAAEAYVHADRYRGDPTPGVDISGSGPTLNGDFGVGFTSWQLRYFDWSLADDPDNDGQAIPQSAYTAPEWQPFPDSGATLFDPPREILLPPTPWVQLWFNFRQALVARYVKDFARTMTTTPDPETGLTIPAAKWSSYQIPADYVYGHTPESPDWRYLTSASSWTTADIRPYGGAGITAFNTYVDGAYFRTLAQVAPLMASLQTRWSIFEWNPSVPSTTDPAIYREDVAQVETWRPHVVAPFAWALPEHGILDTGFEVALNELITRLRSAPWAFKGTVDGSRVRLSWAPPDIGAAPDSYVLEVGTARGLANVVAVDTGSRSVILEAIGPPGVYFLRIKARRGATVSTASNEVRLEINPAAPGAPAGLVPFVSGSTVTFNWLPPASGGRPTRYVLDAGTAPGVANIGTLPLSSASTFVIPGVPGGAYWIQIRAENARGASAPSNPMLVGVPGPGAHCTPVEPPGAIQYRVAGPIVTFEWDAHTNGAAPSGYLLDAGTAPGIANIATVPLGTSRTFSVAVPGGTYYLQLRAFGPCGTSEAGPSVRVVIP